MTHRPVDAYVEGCYPTPTNCTEVTTVTAAADKTYVDWGLDASGVPVALTTVGRKSPNVWKGLPEETGMLCISCGAGVQLPDGSYVLRPRSFGLSFLFGGIYPRTRVLRSFGLPFLVE